MDILAALSAPKPAPALPFGATDAAEPEAGQLFQAILGELGATDEAASPTPGLIAAGQSTPQLRQAAQAAGALRADGAIDLGILARSLRQDIGTLLGGETEAIAAEPLLETELMVTGGGLVPETSEGSLVEGGPPLPDSATALPIDPPVLPLEAKAVVAAQGQAVIGTVQTSGANGATAPDAGATEAAPADAVADDMQALAPSPAKGKAGKAKDAAAPAAPSQASAAQATDGASDAAKSTESGKAAETPREAAKVAEPAPKDKAAKAEATKAADIPGDQDGADVVAADVADTDEPVATAAQERPARKTAKPEPEIGRGADGKAMDAIAANPPSADDQAVAAALAKREARLALDAEAADRRRTAPTAEAPPADAAAQPTGPKPSAAQPQGQATGLAERVAVAAPSAGGDPSGDRNPDRQSDRGAPTDVAQPASATVEAGKSGATDFVQHLAAAKPLRGGAHAPPPAPHQVAVHIQRAGQDGLDRVTIQLRPVELGRIDVRMEFGNDGVMRARIVAENPQTLELLQRDARALEKALQDVGVRTEQGSLSFSLRDDGRSAHQQQDRPGKGRGTAFTLDGDAIANDTPTDRPVRLPAAGRVDVRV